MALNSGKNDGVKGKLSALVPPTPSQNNKSNNISDQNEKTKKDIQDLPIDQIDTDEINEELFGYEDLYLIQKSFDEIGNESIIYVYTRDNGRYLCYAGNQRLLASKYRGEKFITCVISGPEPTKEERVKHLLFMNAQRKTRPYYIAMQLDQYEKILRRKGNKNIPEEIEEQFGYKISSQKMYKRILRLHPSLQELYKKEDTPLRTINSVVSKIPEGKEEEFVKVYNQLYAEEDASSDLFERAFYLVCNNSNSDKVINKPVQAKASQKASQVLKGYKNFMGVEYDQNGSVIINEKKRETILAEAKAIREKVDEVINAYE